MLFRGFIFHFPQRRLRDPIVIGWLRVEHWRYAPRYQAKLEATHGNDSDRRSDRSSTRRRWLLWPWPLVWEASTINVSAVCCAAGSGSSPIGGIFGPHRRWYLFCGGAIRFRFYREVTRGRRVPAISPPAGEIPDGRYVHTYLIGIVLGASLSSPTCQRCSDAASASFRRARPAPRAPAAAPTSSVA